ncbi:MAG TPA: hypothetical protein VJ063_20965 [Verrucomicrobiae bacterium]|nr:hypothetical protein [Verrucomicrobiae bacterium]
MPAFSHDSPEHKINDLSSQLARSNNSPLLLIERALEHRDLGHFADAAADLKAAYQLDSTLTAALKELALVELADGKPDLALCSINQVLGGPASSRVGELPPDFLIARAEIQTARRDYRSALADCEAAFRQPTDNVEWYLIRAQLQRRLGKLRDCLAGLRDGFAKTGSAVLEEEIIDAMIDVGEHKLALKKIERELRDSRSRSSWLIRRARVRLALGQTKSASRDLNAALTELNSRITPDAPDVILIIDRGTAHALLGDNIRARADLALARTLSADQFALWRLEQLLPSV